MGPMSGAGCADWHGAMAMDALGKLDERERAGLQAHLDGCASCREEARSLASTAAVLAYVDPAAIAPTAAVPPMLTANVLGALRTDVRRSRRRRAGALMAVGAVAASTVAIVVLSVASSAPRPTQRVVALRGPAAVTASVVLTERPWGTSLTFRERGQPGGGIYTVTALTAKGSWWSTGTYTTVAGQQVLAQMSCAVPMGQITGVRVTGARGAVVLESAGVAGSPWRGSGSTS